MTTTPATHAARRVRLRESDCSVEDFAAVLAETTVLADYANAEGVEQGVLIYNAATLHRAVGSASGREEIEGELVRALTDGPGLVLLRGAFDDLDLRGREPIRVCFVGQ